MEYGPSLRPPPHAVDGKTVWQEAFSCGLTERQPGSGRALKTRDDSLYRTNRSARIVALLLVWEMTWHVR